jgi:hypothetical protein
MNRTAHSIAILAATAATTGLLCAATASAATVPARCYTGGLALALHRDGAAAGTVYWDVVFTNTTTRPCTLYGYPGVSARTAPAGPRIGHAATRDPAFPASLVTLAPGHAAHAVLGIADAGNWPAGRCHPVAAGAVGVYPPGAVHRMARPLTFTACANRHVHLLSVTTVTPGG